jgi:DNA-binding NarL/FixJ family response regulator
MTRVLIVDDHPGFRARARRMLEADGFEVVGESADGEGALDDARELDPDLVLLDVQLPSADGFAVARELTGSGERQPVVVLTSTRSGEDFGSLIGESGARGFIPKAELTGPAIKELIE